MKVGFIGFGEVASILTQELLKNGVEVYTCLKGRSQRTKDLARDIPVNLCNDTVELIRYSEIIFSAVTPSQALNAAKQASKTRGVYVDLNNISPVTVNTVLGQIETGKTVDAAIMGSVRRNGLKVKILASGPHANKITALNKYGMNIEVIGSEIGQASAIKMLRSTYTKGVSALLMESLYVAYKMGIDDVLKYISETESPEFMESAISRLISSSYHANRRSEEMHEVVGMISMETDPIMSTATLEFFKELKKDLSTLNKKPENLEEIFKALEKTSKKMI